MNDILRILTVTLAEQVILKTMQDRELVTTDHQSEAA